MLPGIVPTMIDDDDLGSLYGFDGLSCGIALQYPGLQLFFQVIPVRAELSPQFRTKQSI